MKAGQSRQESASDGVERLRVATTCGSPLVVLISGRLPAPIVGKAVHVTGAFGHGVYVVGAINPHLFVVDAAADRSVTNAVAVLDDLSDADVRTTPRALTGESDAGPHSSAGPGADRKAS